MGPRPPRPPSLPGTTTSPSTGSRTRPSSIRRATGGATATSCGSRTPRRRRRSTTPSTAGSSAAPRRSRKASDKGQPISEDRLPKAVRAFEALRKATDRRRIAALVREHRFTHEMLLTEWKNDPAVWEALLEDMPQTALIRNLGKMTAVGLLAPGSAAPRKAARSGSPTRGGSPARGFTRSPCSRPSRSTSRATASARAGGPTRSHGRRSREIVDALDEAFYLAFKSGRHRRARRTCSRSTSRAR